MTTLTIYHNPRCSKSRQTLALIEEAGKPVEIIEYLKGSLNEQSIKELQQKLSLSPREMMRTKEAEYKEMALSDASDEQLIAAMVATPKLIERPIVVKGEQAIIGRPPENVLALLD
jgi:arsenate reductase